MRMSTFSGARRPLILRRPILAGTVITGVLVLMTLASMAAEASPIPAASPQTWTTSVSHWYNHTTNRSFGKFNLTYNVTSFYGATDVITATNTSNTTTQMQGLLNVNESLVATWCVPNCTSPEYQYQVTVMGESTESQFLNLTTAATVYENGTAAPALGITNASSSRTENLTEMSNTTFGNWTASRMYNESEAAFYSVEFQSPLGLVPWNLSANLTWNDSANYTAMGGWNATYGYGGSYNGSTYGRSSSYNWSLNRSGRESTRGIDFGNATTRSNRSVIRIGLRYRGALGFDSDLFMTAIGSDLFQGATANWSVNDPNGYEMAGVAMSTVYAEHSAVTTSSGGSGPSSGQTGTIGTTGDGGISPIGGGGSGTNGGASGGSTTGTGGAPGTSPGSTTTTPTGGTSTSPGGSSGITSPTTPSPGSATPPPAHGGSRLSQLDAWIPWIGVLGVLGIGGAVAGVALRRRRSN
jgi:hypothetical protein